MKKIFYILSLFCFVISLGLSFGFAQAAIVTTTTVIKSADLATGIPDVISSPSKWFFYNDETDVIDNTLGSFVTGPGTPPLGTGSAQISVSGTERRNLATYGFAGTKLSEIRELSFSTYNPSASNGGASNRSAYLNFNVDFTGSSTSFQRRLVFVPSQNGSVSQNAWKEWKAGGNGGLGNPNALYQYSGATWPAPLVGPNIGQTGVAGTTLKTWTQIIVDYPNIRILPSDGWLGLRVGEPYADGYTENLDRFFIGIKDSRRIFDFEPTAEVPACNANAIETVLSAPSTQVDSHNALPLSFVHPAWTANIPGATWIWATDPVESPTNDADLTKVFSRTFHVLGTPTSGTLDIAADNTYGIIINGTTVATVTDENNFQDDTQDHYDISSYLVPGANTIQISVTNLEVNQDADPVNNPAGLLFKLVANNDRCITPPPPVDACPNIEGNQTNESDCIQPPTPPVCGENQHLNNENVCVDNEVLTDIINTPTPPVVTQCSDGIDNDGNGAKDFPADSGCTSASDNVEQATRRLSHNNAPQSRGQVLGAETENPEPNTCGIYVKKYLRKGFKGNDTEAVKKLQEFLNKYLHAGLTVDGVFGGKTEAFLKAFQLAHRDKILDPWHLKFPTGIFFKTTQTQVNNIMCPELKLGIPTDLSGFPQ